MREHQACGHEYAEIAISRMLGDYMREHMENRADKVIMREHRAWGQGENAGKASIGSICESMNGLAK